MATDSFYGWVPPTIETVATPDCTIYSNWASAYIHTDDTDISRYDPPIVLTYELVKAIVPSGMEIPTVGQALQWILQADPDLLEYVVESSLISCKKEVCNALYWDGDSDLAGIGVLIVYYLAAALATAYLLLMICDNAKDGNYKRRFWEKVILGFKNSLGVFLDTGLLFALSMLTASVYRHGSSRMNPEKTHSLFQLANATYAGIFSIFPPLLLQLVNSNPKRRRLQAVLWLAVIILAVSSVVLYYSLANNEYKKYELFSLHNATMADAVWTNECEPTSKRQSLEIVFKVALAVLGINSLVYFSYIIRNVIPSSDKMLQIILDQLKKVPILRWLVEHKDVCGPLDASISALIMWILLGEFTSYLDAVSSIMRNSNGYTKWSFGQVLALATWVPVILEIITIYIYGTESAIGSRLPKGYKIKFGEVEYSGVSQDEGKGQGSAKEPMVTAV